ncbi:MAG TPA: NAD(+) kinase [Candidatus Competibacteraceae bacterium]|nr:NAD(+) kinase [Candidatus Competibacteraceae bacterium]
MPYIFNTIGLIGKFGDPSVAGTLNQIATFLRRREFRILCDEATAKLIPPNGLEVASRRTIGRQCDLAIVMGGDGTLLNAARSLVDFQVPILGVNLGRLGFITDVSPGEIPDGLEQVLAGQFREEQRSMLHAEIIRDGQALTQSTALNDVVVHKRDVARMIEVDAYVDGQFLNAYRADGLIISTPTGSTAYALSGGGPIIHPSLEAVLLVPICPHTLTHRPIVLGGDSEIEILVNERNTTHIQVTCDGQISLPIRPGDRILIRKKRRKLRLIHPPDHDYFQLLRAKLSWGVRPEDRG